MTSAVSLRRANGLDRPLYFDRQLLIADDLSLEQGFEDRRLALLARHTLGWGVASGFMLTTRQAAGGIGLVVSPGYGLTPLGDEVYLTQEVVLDGIVTAIKGSCCAPADCANVDASGGGMHPGQVIRAWIVARPGEIDGGPRPAMPEGCGHPGNTMLPSRRCGGARVEIVCSLVAPHTSPPLALQQLHLAVCGPWGPPMPGDVSDAANYVVLGAVEIVPEGVFAIPRDRRLIPRLDTLGRLVCMLHHGAMKYVTHIQRDQEDADRAIDKLAGFDGQGVFFVETLAQAVAQVEAGVIYETLPPWMEGRKLLVRKRKTHKYLQTEGDGLPPNNLLSLPEINDT
jgi:hypothetical protein